MWDVVVGVCCLALQILTLFQSNSYKVNVREYFPIISYVRKWGLSIIDLVTALSILSEGSHILGDTGAASWDDRMFVVKVYCKIEMNPWALTLTKPIPEAFELWLTRKKISGQSAKRNSWVTLVFSYMT